MTDLTKTERYALAQIIVCGEITYEEFKSVNGFLEDVQNEVLGELSEEGVLEQTLFCPPQESTEFDYDKR